MFSLGYRAHSLNFYVLDSRRYNLTTPEQKCSSLGSSLFARRYWGNLLRFLFLCLLRCFTSAGSRPMRFWRRAIRFIIGLGFPIRKSPDQRLLVTYPELIADTPRPSSPQSPKASTICPYLSFG